MGFKPQRFLSVRQVRAEWFPGRSVRWVIDQVKAGGFGDCVRDGAGWLVPELGLLGYVDRHRVCVGEPGPVREEQRSNLVQFR